jgi:hypothetical protein
MAGISAAELQLQKLAKDISELMDKKSELTQKLSEESRRRMETIMNTLNSFATSINKKPLTELVGSVGSTVIATTQPMVTELVAGQGHAAGYIALGVALFIFFYGVSSFTRYNRNPSHPRYSSGSYKHLATVFRTIKPSYKLSMFAQNITPYSGAKQTTNRPTVAGRCDNLTKREVASAKGGMCIKTMQPKSIQWVIAPEEMPELDSLPPSLRTRIEGNQKEKYVVNIPWRVYNEDGFNYYPDCAQAVFSDGTSAAYLFNDNGTGSCDKKILNRLVHTSKSRYLKTGLVDTRYTRLDEYT